MLLSAVLLLQLLSCVSTSRRTTNDRSIEPIHAAEMFDLIDLDDRNVLVFFYDSNARKCHSCLPVLERLEEIDDDLEHGGYINVVKTQDKNLMRHLGVTNLPAAVYYRRRMPVLYDGDFSDLEEFIHWVREHDQVSCIDLDDGDFEDRTRSANPHPGALDWFVMFYDSRNIDCAAHISSWENVAHKLRGLLHVGRIDAAEDDDVAHRFALDDSEVECPTFILFRRGRMYKYHNDGDVGIRALTTFAVTRYKQQRGLAVPPPPTKIEEMYEEVKEYIFNNAKSNVYIVVGAGMGLAISVISTCIVIRLCRRRKKDI